MSPPSHGITDIALLFLLRVSSRCISYHIEGTHSLICQYRDSPQPAIASYAVQSRQGLLFFFCLSFPQRPGARKPKLSRGRSTPVHSTLPGARVWPVRLSSRLPRFFARMSPTHLSPLLEDEATACSGCIHMILAYAAQGTLLLGRVCGGGCAARNVQRQWTPSPCSPSSPLLWKPCSSHYSKRISAISSHARTLSSSLRLPLVCP